jgi:hypothetical protein
MANAINEYNAIANASANQMRTIARAWGIPKSTFHRRLTGKITGSCYQSGRRPVMSKDREDELADVIRMLASRGFPLGAAEVRKLAGQYSKSNNLNLFKKEVAGYYWFVGFMERHQDLRMKKPEALSAARAIGMNKVVINKWFTEYDELLVKLGIKDLPSHIWNCDETGLVDHFERKQAIGVAGVPSYQITANEKGTTVTCVSCFNAMGTYAPLMFFKAKRLNSSWCVGAPDNSMVKVYDNGWINAAVFAEWA